MTPIRTLLADDHAPTRADIREILEDDGRFSVCAEAGDAPAAVRAAVESRPDLCLLDIRMPGSGVLATWEITSRLPAAKVVMLTVSRDDDDLFRALRSGASGYLLKDIDPSKLGDTLAGVFDGEAPLAPSLAARILDELRSGAPRRRALADPGDKARLTSREWEVLDLMRQGLRTAQIAERLGVTSATARSHLSSALRKVRSTGREAAGRSSPADRREKSVETSPRLHTG